MLFLFVFLQEGFCKFSRSAREVSQDSSMKKALFAAAGVGLAGLTFLLVRQLAFSTLDASTYFKIRHDFVNVGQRPATTLQKRALCSERTLFHDVTLRCYGNVCTVSEPLKTDISLAPKDCKTNLNAFENVAVSEISLHILADFFFSFFFSFSCSEGKKLQILIS